MNQEKIVNKQWITSWADFITCVIPIIAIHFLILVLMGTEQKSRKQKLTPALQGYETFFIIKLRGDTPFYQKKILVGLNLKDEVYLRLSVK